ncbi:meiotic nuclear division protein 1 homolog isoform X3 [Hippopotamus amphibius kiboko]|nr:meiotic nuclear division protein 1 homolog isoform X3 [Hippopotamus amphibius kiboko]XP_057581428.1 meiotic nuclear division protein 1 homolog isoform X3 [Hippopotamus amphibius kiboko]XP_057581429.1 meiotic nuclear division protein 1 homolog isoform X3 [Hippopotamus amphibius kiboko]
MMEIFFETKDVFQLKDMEKIAPKEKGITAMSVKEVLQSLVDDGMVDCERIGTSNYYWAFPSKALHTRKRKLEVLESQLSEGNQKHANLQKSVEKAKIGRHETEERTLLAKELSLLRGQREQLKAEVEKYKECDPQVVEEIRQANKVAKEAANRWTVFREEQRSPSPLLTPSPWPDYLEAISLCGGGKGVPFGNRSNSIS